MGAVLLPILLVLVAGALNAVQGPTNAMLAKGGGSLVAAALISFAVGTAAIVAVALVAQPRVDWAALRALPRYAWLGGLYGAFYVGAFAFSVPRLGVAAALCIAAAGQLAAALLLDRYGLIGVPRDPLSWTKAAGVALVLAGIVLVRWK